MDRFENGESMSRLTRRRFLQSASASVACAAGLFECDGLYASPFGLPLALQLYSVRQMLARDFAGTLKLIAGIGYREVESAGYYNHTAQEVGLALQVAGLQMPSAHFPHDELSRDFDQILEFNKAVGVRYIICSFPGLKDQGGSKILHSTSWCSLLRWRTGGGMLTNSTGWARESEPQGCSLGITITRWSFDLRVGSCRLKSCSG